MADPMFPELPEELSAASDDELVSLVDQHLEAQRLIRENNLEFLGDLAADSIIEQARQGKAQLAAIRAEQELRLQAAENYVVEIDDLTDDCVEVFETVEDEEEPEEDEAEAVVLAAVEEDETVLVVASADTEVEKEKVVRRPPNPAKDRKGVNVGGEEIADGTTLCASGDLLGYKAGETLNPTALAKVMIEKARRIGKPTKGQSGIEEKYLLAFAQYQYPENRRLTTDLESNSAKVRALTNTDGFSLVAAGGLCAPLTPIYSIPQFAVNARPVRDALPSFNADRGGINVPVPTTLASADGAITIITEANDALGGTFATKDCLSQDCLTFTETAVTIISHCREYGNLNARAWPESITFENELTMAQHARVAESYLLDRIKAQSINVTSADVYSSVWDLIYAITRTASSIRYVLRTGENVRLRALLPSWVPDMLVADVAGNQFDRFITRARATQILRDAGVEPTYYLDTPNSGTSQGFADETASAIDDFPDVVQFAVYVEGAFIHVDGGSLELGIVRDSTLNSTNDFQVFGETFENVALLGPAQSARWITATVCPSGELPSLVTALNCGG